MVIAIPTSQGRVSPVLDDAARLLVVRRNQGRIVDCREVSLGLLPADALARSVKELEIDVLLCAAVSESLLRQLHSCGIRVRSHLCGDVQSILQAFCGGHLHRREFRMPGCWGRHLEGTCACTRRRRALATRPPLHKLKRREKGPR
jgi:predicted Fe-Mo cluster-binding NifX family protein